MTFSDDQSSYIDGLVQYRSNSITYARSYYSLELNHRYITQYAHRIGHDLPYIPWNIHTAWRA